MDIVLATGNAGKVREINQMLAGQRDIVAVPQSQFEVEDIEETGLSFIENAILKARNAAYVTGLPAIADDSGLEVDWLQGAPGIYSARYAGPAASDADNVDKLLREMADADEGQRAARFRCVMVCLRHATDPTPLVCQGTWEGRIGAERSGSNGFGYDPVFYVPDLECMAADLKPEVKNKLSHRGQALQQLAAGFAAHMGLK